MTPIHLERREPARNRLRFHAITVTRTPFDGWAVVRERAPATLLVVAPAFAGWRLREALVAVRAPRRHQAALLRGRPPSLPLARLAATLAALRDWPPALPILAAIQFFDPK